MAVLNAATGFQVEMAVAADGAARTSFRGREQTTPPSADPHAVLGASLQSLFEGWALPDTTKLAMQPGGTGWAAIDAHFAKLSERFGFKAVPHEDLADDTAGALVKERRFDDAVRALEKNKEWHPGSAVVWNHLGDAYRALCRWPESKEHYTKAHELAQAMSYGNVSNYAMELSRITQEIEAKKPCVPPSGK